MATTEMEKKLQVRMPQTLYDYIARKAKKLGFRHVSEYIRHVFNEERLKDIQSKMGGKR